ncbi:MAG TPA: S4 domain-containing protein, partial [Nitrososphaerales archaeon]|nr:S4 domain-containing protein [Nitrososphaerales archaeon]
KGMSLSALHSRQLIVHGHVSVGARVITVPGYEVGSQEEGMIGLAGGAHPKEEQAAPAPEQQAKEEPAAEPAQAQ